MATYPAVLRTFRDHFEHGHRLACWCPGNLAELVMQGLGDREVSGCRPRYRKCGSQGPWRVRPPTP